jgi:signal transduction histidine kinase
VTDRIEHVRLFHEIQEKSRQLEIASQHKSQFLANRSHELRTPLNASLGYTELIVDGIHGEVPNKLREVMERIEKSGRHLLGLIKRAGNSQGIAAPASRAHASRGPQRRARGEEERLCYVSVLSPMPLTW